MKKILSDDESERRGGKEIKSSWLQENEFF